MRVVFALGLGLMLVAGPVTATVIDDVISPGNSPGCVVDHGSVTLSPGATLRIELQGTTVCTEYDRFTVQQALSINGATLEVIVLAPYVPQAGDRFTVLEWGTLNGNFSTIDLTAASLDDTLSWDTSQLTTTGELIVMGPPQAIQVPLPVWLSLLSGTLFFVVGNKRLSHRLNR